MNSNHRADGALARARQAAAGLKPVARGGSAAARHSVQTARAWAAPQLERTGRVVEDRIGPKISALLYSASQRVEPGKPDARRWRKVAGVSMVTAAASALTGVVLGRRRQHGTAPESGPDGAQEAAARSGEVGTAIDAEGGGDGQASSS